MEKNVTIIDHDGNVIGSTYPKRAQGLVKKGRAEPVDDFTIMMPDAHVPTVDNNKDNTEEINMSKVIGFEARGFKIDPTCKSNNVATRMFVTDALGNNVEVYEIGDHNYNWTQISCEMPVAGDEDYEFLFAMTGDIDSRRLNDQVKCSFMIVPIHDKVKALTVDSDGVIEDSGVPGEAAGIGKSETESDEDWENRYQYSLIRREYRPTMEKLWNGESLRFYRIPFNTGDADRIRFVFLAFTEPYKVFPVKNFEEYAKLPDYDPEAGRFGGFGGPGDGPWFGQGFGPGFGPGKDGAKEPGKDAGKGANKGWNSNRNRGPQGFNGGPNFRPNGSGGWYSGPKGFKDVEQVLNNIGNIVNNAVREAMSSIEGFRKGGFGPNCGFPGGPDGAWKDGFGNGPESAKRYGAGGKRVVFPEMLSLMLKKLDEDDEVLDLANCEIRSGSDFVPGNDMDGDTVDSITFALDNSLVDGDAFCRIMSKVGDSCKVNANNTVLGAAGHGPELAGVFSDRVDDTEFHFVNSQISEAAFISILSKVGDCCYVDFSNSDIKDFEELKDLSGFIHDTFDDTEIRVDNTSMSQRFYQALVRACGEESKITGKAVIR